MEPIQKPTTTKAVIYCRVSSQKQMREGDGLESQRARCEEFARYRGYDVVEIFKDDASGSVVKRPAMKAMLSFLKSKRVQHIVIIDDISRLARGIEAHFTLRAAIKNAGGILQSPSIEFGDDSDSSLMENVLASVSQHQRQKNGEQTKNRMRGRMLNGYWSFRAPFGYVFKRVGAHGKMLIRDEPAASAVRDAYEGYASGRFQTLSEVMRFLESNPAYPRDRSARLSVERVTEILTRPHYAGYIDAPNFGVHMQPAKHEALISLATYKAVQARMLEKAKVPARKDINLDFPLRGFVECADCGQAHTACWTKGRSARYPYYICQTKNCVSYGKSIKRDVMEQEFESMLTTLRPSAELYELATELFRDLWNARLAASDDTRAQLKTQAVRIERQIEQLIDRIINSDSPTLANAYENRVRSLENEKIELAEQIKNCGRPLASFDDTYRTAMGFLENPINLWESNKLEDKRAVLKMLFASRISYQRGTGFRTAKTTIPFSIFNGLDSSDSEEPEMVRLVLLEPGCASRYLI